MSHQPTVKSLPPVKIHPVIMAVPGPERKLKGREKLAALRQIARKALHRSAHYSGVILGPLEKAENGAPLPSNGIYWSLTHKESYVAAVTAPHPIGIDIEKDRPCSKRLYQRLAAPREWQLAQEVNQTLLYRYWTAKEAVLKAVGKGLAGLTRCQIVEIVDDTHLKLTYDDTVWQVTQFWIAENHIVAVTFHDTEIEWHQPDRSERN
jgi:4'-phosphopantetheinyl transferase